MLVRLTLILIIVPYWAFSQVQMSVDPVFSIEQTFRTLQSDNFLLLQTRNLTEKRRTGVRFGANFNFYLGELYEEKVALKTGMRYLRTGYRSSLDSISSIHQWLEIPLTLRYYYAHSKFRFFSELGVGLLVNLNFDIDDFTNERLLHHSGIIAIGLDYDYNLDLSFFIQPTFRFHFTQTFSGLDVEEHLYNYGLELGSRLKF